MTFVVLDSNHSNHSNMWRHHDLFSLVDTAICLLASRQAAPAPKSLQQKYG